MTPAQAPEQVLTDTGIAERRYHSPEVTYVLPMGVRNFR